MDTPLIQQGLNLMLYGMGVVFVFLTVLVASVMSMSTAIARFFPDSAGDLPTDTHPGQADGSESEATNADPKLRKIIQAAIDQHRRR